MLHFDRHLVLSDLVHITSNIGMTNIWNCDFEGMPKYGVTPLLSPFDIDFDRPFLAAALWTAGHKNAWLASATMPQLLIWALLPYLGDRIKNESRQFEYTFSMQVKTGSSEF